jgi:hypothetical protein
MLVIDDFEIDTVEIRKGGVKVSILLKDGRVDFSSNDLAISDVARDVEKTTELEVFWETIAAGLRKKIAELNTEKERILSFWRRYVKWWLRGRGEKDTLEGRQDGLILLFSKKTPEKERRINAMFAYGGYLEEIEKRKLSVDETNRILEWAKSGNGNEEQLVQSISKFLNFYNEMMTYSKGEEGIWYEDLIEFELKLKEVQDIAEAFANAYRQKAVLLASVVSGRRSLGAMKEELLRFVMDNGSENKITNNKEVPK